MQAQNPFEAVQAIMRQNLDSMGGAAQSYIDMVEKTLRTFPGANQEQIGTFTAYIERQVAANRNFMDKLLHATNFQDVFRIQVEYFQSQLRGASEEASGIGATIAVPFRRTT